MEYYKICPSCGIKNKCSNSFCECGVDLASVKTMAAAAGDEKAAGAFSADRPGCLTVYALLIYGSGVAFSLLGVAGGIAALIYELINGPASYISMTVFIIAGSAGFAAFYSFLTRGYLEMRPWARYWAILVHGMNVPGSLTMSCSAVGFITAAIDRGDSGAVAIAVLAAATMIGVVALNGYTLYWFIKNGKYFS
ncbi:MAG: hypothetical protein JW929_11580 [Anaerolineales bacterium]|nr:hypothetical protein [Anaerolineales bacterium]